MKAKNVLTFTNVTKKINDHIIIKNINLSITEGETVGIMGTNGSGKTTILRMAAGLSYPTEGEIHIKGEKLSPGYSGKLSSNTSALIETPTFLPYWSGFQNLLYLSKIRNCITEQDIKEIMKQVGLDPKSKKKFRTYSLGMRQRLGIAQAFMERADLVLLDEPTNGLDKTGKALFSELVVNAKKVGTTIVFVSHNDDEIKSLCDRVLKIEDNLVVEEQSYQEVKIKLQRSEDIANVLRIVPASYLDKDSIDDIIMIVPLNIEKDAFFTRLEDQKIQYILAQEL